MKIEELQIDGFGDFHGRDFGPFERPLTVVLGDNEAGKSTLLAFIRTMFFGFPARGREQFYPPMAGGQHGGKVALRGEDGQRYVVERMAGVRGGTIRITTEEGQIFSTDAELRRLLGHATEAMYENVFAFGLGELQTKRSLDGPEVSGQIYSAGLGAASLPGALAGLTQGAEKLFKPGGSNQKVAEILTKLQATEGSLADVRGDSDEYGRLTARLGVIADDLVAASAEAGRFSRRAAELERLRNGWAEWLPLVELRSRRADLPELRFSLSPRLRGSSPTRRACGRRKRAYARRLARLKMRPSALPGQSLAKRCSPMLTRSSRSAASGGASMIRCGTCRSGNKKRRKNRGTSMQRWLSSARPGTKPR